LRLALDRVFSPRLLPSARIGPVSRAGLLFGSDRLTLMPAAHADSTPAPVYAGRSIGGTAADASADGGIASTGGAIFFTAKPNSRAGSAQPTPAGNPKRLAAAVYLVRRITSGLTSN
jgi:hypothetical protein